jgi:FtsP/CotA-like multicopper oxidase with cupredoxin domain
MSSYAVDPGTALPRVSEMTDFNMWTWSNRVFPGIDPLPVRLGDKVRVRMANLTMTNHPIHLHGHRFAVSCTDGGWMLESAQWPQATVDVPVGEIRAIDFAADNPGDWAFHCHKSHHTMNAMGHNTRKSHRRQAEATDQSDPQRGARLHADGLGRHGRDGRDGNAAS